MRQRIQRFSRILRLRENDRQAEQIVLAEERQEEDTVLRHLDSLRSEKTKAIEDFVGEMEKTLSPQSLWLQRQCIDVVEKHIDKGKEQLSDVRRKIAGTEERLLERHRDVRVMEGYVEHLRTEERKILFDVEQIELDDIAVMRYSHASIRSQRGGQDNGVENHQAKVYSAGKEDGK